MDSQNSSINMNLPPIEEQQFALTNQDKPPIVANQPFSSNGQIDAVSGNSQQVINSQNVGNLPSGNGQVNIAVPAIADDVDLIEKEWIKKINSIIASTKNNPYEQSRQLALLKMDYLQKRYNKVIKLS